MPHAGALAEGRQISPLDPRQLLSGDQAARGRRAGPNASKAVVADVFTPGRHVAAGSDPAVGRTTAARSSRAAAIKMPGKAFVAAGQQYGVPSSSSACTTSPKESADDLPAAQRVVHAHVAHGVLMPWRPSGCRTQSGEPAPPGAPPLGRDCPDAAAKGFCNRGWVSLFQLEDADLWLPKSYVRTLPTRAEHARARVRLQPSVTRRGARA